MSASALACSWTGKSPKVVGVYIRNNNSFYVYVFQHVLKTPSLVFRVIAVQVDSLGKVFGEGGRGLEAATINGFQGEVPGGEDGWLETRRLRKWDDAMDQK